MEKARIKISKDFIIDKTDDRLFGSFVEHMGSVVHNGIFEPDHPTADNNGFRQDVLKYVDELNLSVIRYPGGNYTSGYDWKKTIGPVKDRPTTLELAWRQIEPNTFGLNEFMIWAKRVNVEPIMTINLGTKGIEDAAEILEYCNFEKGTYWSDMRIQHGIKKPYNIKTWCLGNELDGDWQIAKKTAEDYGRLACEAAKVMRLIDPEIELVAVGSSARFLDSFPNWDMIVMMHTYEVVDYLSVHNYINKKDDDIGTYLARPIEMEKQINEVIAACDYVKGVKKTDKTMYLSFDEFNVHKEPEIDYIPWQTGYPFDWCQYNMEDTLVFGSMLMTILRHADRIKIACQSLLVNTIPLILTVKGKSAWRNATYYPLQQVSKFGRGKVLRSSIVGPTYSVDFEENVQAIDQVVVLNKEEKTLAIFCINRMNEPIEVVVETKETILKELIEHQVMTNQDLTICNTIERQEAIVPSVQEGTVVTKDEVTMNLQPYSWNMIRISVTG
jgi:alpha-N-arabinofuranosidase